MCRRDLLRYGQSESAATVTGAAGAGTIESGESIEYALLIVDRHGRSVIRNRDQGAVSFGFQGDRNSGSRMPSGVVTDISHHPGEVTGRS